ncbi:hypothetical protein [Muricoccus radiodurans]|uniref:hypothetical protein n=1 Tax=Muricoccus radiodurans TaxID=2231721 RepID=UPI003CF9293B
MGPRAALLRKATRRERRRGPLRRAAGPGHVVGMRSITALLAALALTGCAAFTWGEASRVLEATEDGITIQYDRLIVDAADLMPAAQAHCLRQGRETAWLPAGQAGGFETLRAACREPERALPMAEAGPPAAPPVRAPRRRVPAPRGPAVRPAGAGPVSGG